MLETETIPKEIDKFNYKQRLRIPIEGNPDTKLYSKNGQLLFQGYTRIVIGGRGPYVETELENLNAETWLMTEEKHRYYDELRSELDNVKCYYQWETVDYADYKVGMCYINPFDLYIADGIVLIENLRNKET